MCPVKVKDNRSLLDVGKSDIICLLIILLLSADKSIKINSEKYWFLGEKNIIKHFFFLKLAVVSKNEVIQFSWIVNNNTLSLLRLMLPSNRTEASQLALSDVVCQQSGSSVG